VSDIDGSEGPSPASALAFGVVFMAVFAAVALVAAFLVATPKTKVVAASAPTTTVADTTLPVTLAEFTITAPDTVTPGIKTLQITNAGMMQHELLVFRTDLPPSAYPIDPATGDLNEDGAGITKVSDGDNLDPGSTQSRSIDLSQPGTYSFVCNLPGHFRSGMVRTLTVAPRSRAESSRSPISRSEPGRATSPPAPISSRSPTAARPNTSCWYSAQTSHPLTCPRTATEASTKTARRWTRSATATTSTPEGFKPAPST
jgi:uncharacterized cupredoxin-like copper-binding protein